jgi:hypothetical protein
MVPAPGARQAVEFRFGLGDQIAERRREVSGAANISPRSAQPPLIFAALAFPRRRS